MKQPVILYADDMRDDVILFETACRKMKSHIKLQVVDDGQKAIDYLSGNGLYQDRELYPIPQLLLLDLKMPRKSGFETLSFLQDRPGKDDLKILIFSSSQNESDIGRAYDLGTDWYVTKPIDFLELQEFIKVLDLFLNSKRNKIYLLPTYCPPPVQKKMV